MSTWCVAIDLVNAFFSILIRRETQTVDIRVK